jgi:uridine kinase
MSEQRRTLRFAVSLASLRAFPDRCLVGGYAISTGYWFHHENKTISEEEVKQLSAEVAALVAGDFKIEAVSLPFAQAVEYFEANQQPKAASLVRTNAKPEIDCWSCAGQYRLRHFALLPSVGSLDGFELKAYRDGVIAIYSPATWVDQPALASSFLDHKQFNDTTGVHSVGQVNELRLKGETAVKEYMLFNEFRQNEKLVDIARSIYLRGKGQPNSVRVLCIAGPTSSGKTTFATKLAMYLRNHGFHAKALSVDHYYLSLPDQPVFIATQDRTKVDYDSIEAMDVKLVGEHVTQLIDGKTIETPIYDFKSGLRSEVGHEFTLPENGILVMEGIHALNPEYTVGIDPKIVFRVYISPLTGLLMDDFNAVKSTNHRCLRRLCRDSKFRGYTATRVLQMWPKVRNGEGLYIFPHQNNADYVMNSATEYELPVLKSYTFPLLKNLAPSADPEYAQAQELVSLLDSFSPWPSKDVPPSALLREFIGDGSFDCH